MFIGISIVKYTSRGMACAPNQYICTHGIFNLERLTDWLICHKLILTVQDFEYY